MTGNKDGICENCSKSAIIAGKGRCATCLQYLRRRGFDRPQGLINRHVFCVDCKVQLSVTIAGRCYACHVFFATHGKKRPAHLRNRWKSNCKNPACRKPLRLCDRATKGRCFLCHLYYKKRGIDRPKNLARFELLPGYISCENRNCDKPITFGLNWNGRKHRCYTCYKWLVANGEDRPRELCPQRVTELGWCECGNVASHQMEYKFGEAGVATGELNLCDECHQLELDYQTGVGV